MNATIPLSALLLIVAGAGAAYLIYRLARAIENSTRRNFEAVTANTVAINQLREMLSPAGAELQANMAAVPKLLEAVAKVGQAQLDMMQSQQSADLQQREYPFGPSNAIPQRDVVTADAEYDVAQLMRSTGVSREEALMQMNGANNGSVWDGNNLLSNWGR